MLNCSPQSSLPVPWPFWELRGCTAGDITLFKERAGVARSAQIIPAVKQNLIKVESFFFSLRLCHGVFSNLKITNCGQKGRIVVASRAFVYTNAIFALQNACWAVPNPLHSAPFRCRLRVFSKRFYLYKVEFQDSCALQFWWRHLKPNEQPATASTVSEVIMLAVLRSERKTFDISAGSWYTTSNPCESVGGDCVAFPVLSCSWRSKQRRTIYRCI